MSHARRIYPQLRIQSDGTINPISKTYARVSVYRSEGRYACVMRRVDLLRSRYYVLINLLKASIVSLFDFIRLRVCSWIRISFNTNFPRKKLTLSISQPNSVDTTFNRNFNVLFLGTEHAKPYWIYEIYDIIVKIVEQPSRKILTSLSLSVLLTCQLWDSNNLLLHAQ